MGKGGGGWRFMPNGGSRGSPAMPQVKELTQPQHEPQAVEAAGRGISGGGGRRRAAGRGGGDGRKVSQARDDQPDRSHGRVRDRKAPLQPRGTSFTVCPTCLVDPAPHADLPPPAYVRTTEACRYREAGESRDWRMEGRRERRRGRRGWEQVWGETMGGGGG